MGKIGKAAKRARAYARIGRELVSGLRAGSSASPVDLGDYTPPAGVAEFSRHAHASVEVPLAADVVSAYLADLSQIPKWLTMHAGWRGEAPVEASPGVTFTQQARLMGIPADVAWTVVAADDSSIEMRGDGPMGLKMGFWLTTESSAGSTTVHFDAGLGGQPIEGPMGLVRRAQPRRGDGRIARQVGRCHRRIGSGGRSASCA